MLVLGRKDGEAALSRKDKAHQDSEFRWLSPTPGSQWQTRAPSGLRNLWATWPCCGLGLGALRPFAFWGTP